jgi:aminoglycoside phosphotransferase (APT) family kinase protein
MEDWRARLEAWFSERMPSAEHVEITRIGRLPAGASNETLSLDISVQCDGYAIGLPLVLRPERAGGILAPYDVARQFRVMRALSRTDVPAPAVAWYESDRAVLGAPFFCMWRISGETLPLFWYGDSPRLRAAARMLATVHAVEWRTAGLAFLREQPEASPTEGELASWRARAEHLRIGRAPLLVALGDFLRRNEPADARLALLHGDPNPGNYLFRGVDVVGVVDWELAAIGDPRSDLGFYAGLLTVFGGLPGEGGRTLLANAYEAETGRALHNLDYYEALGLYRMAIVMAAWASVSHFGMDAIARRLTNLLGPRWAA